MLIFVQKKKKKKSAREAVIFVSIFLFALTNHHLCTRFKISLKFIDDNTAKRFIGSKPQIIYEIFPLQDCWKYIF